MAHGYALQRARAIDEADELFARACQLGSALGCTNFAAALWVRHDERPGAEACARQLFERACDVGEPHGCGMLGRMMATSARTDAERIAARKHFARVCDELGGSSCRMFAHHLELGQLGPYAPDFLRALMFRGCQTGDADACGRDTATETFR